MAQTWFVSRGERVYGPWSTDEVIGHRGQGNINDADVIWGAGRDHWVQLDAWSPKTSVPKNAAPKPEPIAAAAVAKPAPVVATQAQPVAATPKPTPVAAAIVARLQPTATPTADTVGASPMIGDEETVVRGINLDQATPVLNTAATEAAPNDDSEEITAVRPAPRLAAEQWHYAVDGRSMGPFSRDALLVELRRLPGVDGVSLWTKGMREWAPLAEFHDVMNDIGANRRVHPRASATGVVTLKYDGLVQPAPLMSISEGGVRVGCESQLRSGEIITLEIKAEGIAKPFAARAEVRYCANGVVGLKFEGLDASSRSLIAGYVNHHADRAANAA